MKKELSVRRLFIDSLGFIGNNIPLLCVLTIFSFAGSYLAGVFGAYKNLSVFLLYGVFIYFFYFCFVSLYFGQKPLITKEKFVDSLIKFITVVAFSFFVIVCGKLGLNLLRYLSKNLIGFPDLYEFLRQTYIFLVLNPYAKVLLLFGAIFLLSFSFLIPLFGWVSVINNKDSSIISAFYKVRGNYLKTILVFLLIFALLPLIISVIGLNSSRTILYILHSVLTVFQIVVYLHLYETFYKE